MDTSVRSPLRLHALDSLQGQTNTQKSSRRCCVWVVVERGPNSLKWPKKRLFRSGANVSGIGRSVIRGIDGDYVVEASQTAENEIVGESGRCDGCNLRESSGR